MFKTRYHITLVGFGLLLIGNIYFLIRHNIIETRADELQRNNDALRSYIGRIYRHPELLCDSALTKDNVLSYIKLKGIRWPNVVWAQSMIETGYLSCNNCCLDYNNLFGFMLGGKCMRFATWQECVDYYFRWQNKLYKSPHEDYLRFLKRVGYAEFSEYNLHISQVLKDNKLNYTLE